MSNIVRRLRRSVLTSCVGRTAPRRSHRVIRLEALEQRETPAAISGLVFFDFNGNGTQELGETAVKTPVVIVQLDKGADGTIDATTTTDALGKYAFAGVADGDHKVILTVPAGFAATSDNPLAVAVTGGADATGRDFALQPGGSISGVVFEDKNANGVRDEGEPAVPGVGVAGDAFADGTTDFTATSDGEGKYSFTGVPDGDTKVTVTALPGYETLFGGAVTVTVAGAAAVSQDLALAKPAVISGTAFADYNGDGVQGPGEPGLPGVTVGLDQGADGSTDVTTTTSAGGTFGFTAVADGTHRVVLTTPAGFTAKSPDTLSVLIDKGVSVTNLAFALQPNGKVSGVAFTDANANGVRDTGEAVVAGATVELDVDGAGTAEFTTTTGADGKYTLTGVPDGTHTLTVTKAGLVPVVAGGVPVTVAAAAAVTKDIGLGAPAVVTGTAFADYDGDGIQDALEPGLAGVSVALDLDADGKTDATTATLADGSFGFTAVPEGNHKIVFTAPAGFTARTDAVVPFTVGPAGAEVRDKDFALQPNGSVAGVAFADFDGDNVRDGLEPGQAGVPISLDVNNDGTVEFTTTTGADGKYTFTGVPDGTHKLSFAAPAGFTTVGAVDRTVTVVNAGAVGGQDVAVRPAGRVSGLVFQDVNGNGKLDAGEPGLPGAVVGVDVTGDGKAEILLQTDAAGKYSTPGIPDGTAKVTVIVPPGFTAKSATTLTATVAKAGEVADLNFALQPGGMIAGAAFQDSNGNGKRDTGEPGLGAVTVNVDLFGDGTVDLTTKAAADGTFAFANVPDGTHKVAVTGAAGLTPTTANPLTVTIFNGKVVIPDPAPPGQLPANPVAFGFAKPAVVVAGAFNDVNGNGKIDAGEKGIPGITIGLDLGADGTIDQTLTTDAAGTVIFTTVADGNHRLVVTVPTGRIAVGDVTKLDAVVAGGKDVSGLVFALQSIGTVTGVVFDDRNANGTQDAGEPGLAGVTVTIAGATGDPLTAQTGADGKYSVTGLADGTYEVSASAAGFSNTTTSPLTVTVSTAEVSPVVPRADFGLAKSAVVSGVVFADFNGNGRRDAGEPGLPGITVNVDLGNDGTTDVTTTTAADGAFALTGVPDGIGTISAVVPAGFTATSVAKVTLAVGGKDVGGFAFALRPTGGLSGLVYDDRNKNGRRDPGEPGIAGATVEVDAEADGTIDFATQTDATGGYLVAGVPDGTALVRVVAPTGFAAGPLTPAVLGGFVTAGGTVGGLDFGLVAVAPSVVSGVVFFDRNGDGVRDSAETAAVSGVFVRLDVNGDGTIDFTTQTDGSGKFTFTGVPNGKHQVTVAAPTGFDVTTTLPLTVPVNGVDIGGLAIGVRPTGLPTSGVTGTITGKVFRDENGNGQLDPEDGPLAGMTVQVFPAAQEASPGFTVTTDVNGQYTVAGLADGIYVVNADGLGGVAAVATVTIEAGGTVTQDLGLQPVRFLTVRVFADLNGNGLRDANEPAAPNVTVNFDEDADGTVDATAVTDANGLATFDDLPDGNHKVSINVTGATVTTLPTTVNVLNGVVTPTGLDIGFRLQSAATTTIAVGTDAQTINTAQIFDGNGRPVSGPASLTLPTPTGVRTATGDVNGDGVDDYALGSGPGAPTLVRVIDGKTGAELFSINPFEAAFTGGVFVALGDVTGDGRADLVITPDEGGGPRVRVFDAGNNFAQLADYFGIEDPNFRGGARAAIGDVNADGVGDVVVAAGFLGGPRVAVWDGKSLRPATAPRKLANDFFVFEQTLRNGVFVAVGDVDGDGFADVIAGGGPGGGPRVFAVSGKDLVTSGGATITPLANFFAGGADNDRTGVKLAVKDLDGDAKADIVTGYKPNPTAVPRTAAYLGKTLSATSGTPAAYFDVEPFPGFTGGIFVG